MGALSVDWRKHYGWPKFVVSDGGKKFAMEFSNSTCSTMRAMQITHGKTGARRGQVGAAYRSGQGVLRARAARGVQPVDVHLRIGQESSLQSHRLHIGTPRLWSDDLVDVDTMARRARTT